MRQGQGWRGVEFDSAVLLPRDDSGAARCLLPAVVSRHLRFDVNVGLEGQPEGADG